MSKKPIFLISLEGKTLEEAKEEVKKAFRKFDVARNKIMADTETKTLVNKDLEDEI